MRTGKSHGFISYNKLGPFTKLATSYIEITPRASSTLVSCSVLTTPRRYACSLRQSSSGVCPGVGGVAPRQETFCSISILSKHRCTASNTSSCTSFAISASITTARVITVSFRAACPTGKNARRAWIHTSYEVCTGRHNIPFAYNCRGSLTMS
jgi:hypothetical protein